MKAFQKSKSLTLALGLPLALTTAQAVPMLDRGAPTGTHEHLDRPDGHAPLSIMGDHTHDTGEWMLSYRFMRMDMDGMRHGTDRASAAEVFAEGYTVTPTEMTMDMHMLGAMYAPSDQWTLMVMANYLDIEMDHRINPMAPAMLFNAVGGDEFTTKTNGWGDTRLGALFQFFEAENRSAHIGLGLSLPTGSIDEKDRTPRPGMPPTFEKNQLPAPMQLGSGTFDLLPSITWLHQFERWSYGAQANAVIRLEDENDNGYRLGHRFEALGWTARNLTDWLAVNGGLSYRATGKLDGAQENVGTDGPMGLRSVPTAFEDNYGGERLDLILGLNLLSPRGTLEGHRLAVDLRLPIWQDLNGYQLETDSVLTVGWQKAF